MEQYIQEENKVLPRQKLESFLAAATPQENSRDCYVCNICLDDAEDPVVTLCGHLYCWPCIYKWIHSQTFSTTQQVEQQCPVCKATITKTTLVPLYGRGQASSQPESKNDLKIPSRPQACGVQALITAPSTSRPTQNVHRYPYYESQPQLRPHHHQSMATVQSTLHPMIGMLGEMVYTSVFGDAQASFYWYPNSYQNVVSSPRVRRQEQQAEKSLNRVSIFFFCCFVLCLLLF